MESSQTKRLYTTHEVARLLGVTPITVIRWLDGGKFKCFTTVGGHRRVEHQELVHFAKTYNLPWQGEEEVKKRKEFVVLAVDDESDVLELIRDMVSTVPDLELIEVSNGFSAGAKLVEKQPDLVLLDFLMPELDGFEFCQFMRQDPRFKNVPILAVTGLKNNLDLTKIKECGVNDVLSKPFTEDLLLEKIEYFRDLKKGGSSSETAAG